jgi:hypothetical protein
MHRKIVLLFLMTPWLLVGVALCLSASQVNSVTASFSGSAPPQTGKNGELVGGPVLGYVFDQATHEIREITGIPGAALIGRLIQTEFPIRSAWISPKQAIALGQSPGEDLYMVNLAENIASCKLIGTLNSQITKVSWSTSGTSAVAITKNLDQLLLLHTANAFSPSLQEVALRGLQGEITALAVSDDGQSILAGLKGEDGTSLQAILPDGSLLPIASLPSVSALAFQPGGKDLFVADRIGNSLYSVKGIPSNPQVSPLVFKDLELANPAALAFNSRGDLLAVGNSAAPFLSILDFKRFQAFRIESKLTLDQWTPWPSGDVIQLQEYSGGPLSLLQLTPEGSRLTFVPADPLRRQARQAAASGGKTVISLQERERRSR